MMFFFKPTTVVVDAFTTKAHVFEFAKIQKTIKFIPDWWRLLPKSYRAEDLHDVSTMKRCSGFVQQYAHGFVIPMWSDLAVEVGEEGVDSYRYQYADKDSSLGVHAALQYSNHFPVTKYQHIKLNSPWRFRCKKDINFQFMGMPWSLAAPESVVVLPGIVEYKHNAVTHINMFIVRGAEKKIVEFQFNTPIVQIVPLTEKRVEVRNHLVDENDSFFDRLAIRPFTFTQSYTTQKNAKCPYSRREKTEA